MTNRRTEEYRRRLEARGAQWSSPATDDDKTTPHIVSFGHPVAFEYQAIRHAGMAISDRSELELMVLSGKDLIPWLQGLVTSNVFKLEREGSGQRTHAVNHVGRTISDGALLHIPELLLWSCEPGYLSPELKGHLERHIIMEQVELKDRSQATARLTLFGQEAAATLKSLAKLQHDPTTLSGFEGTWGELLGCDVIVQHTPITGQWAVDLLVDRQDAATLWDELLKQAPGLIPVGQRAIESARQEAGYVRFGVDYDTQVIPIEADLNDTISYDKGCYLGQEVIHRLDTRGRPAKMLRQIVPQDDGQWLEPGLSIEVEGKRVGEVMHIFDSPLTQKRLATAMIKRPSYEPHTQGTSQDHALTIEPIGWALRQHS